MKSHLLRTAFIYTLIIALPSKLSAQNQDIEKLMTRRALNCADIRYNSLSLFSDYYRDNKLDSAKIIIDYWEKRCAQNEESFRAKTLLEISEGIFYDENENILNYLLQYQNLMEIIKDFTANPNSLYSSHIWMQNEPLIFFNSSTQSFARELQKGKVKDEYEQLILQFYSNDFEPLLLALKSNELHGTKMQDAYNKLLKDAHKLPEGHYSFFTGIWIPRGNAALLGNHPELGFQLGFKQKKVFADLTFAIKFINSPSPYQVLHEDQVVTTRHFFGGYAGIDGGRELIRTKNSELSIVCGMGWDGFDAIKGDTDQNIKAKTINAFNVNGGIGYRHFIKNGFYAGSRVIYNVVNYNNKGGTDLSGNTISVRFFGGVSRNDTKERILRALRH